MFYYVLEVNKEKGEYYACHPPPPLLHLFELRSLPPLISFKQINKMADKAASGSNWPMLLCEHETIITT